MQNFRLFLAIAGIALIIGLSGCIGLLPGFDSEMAKLKELRERYGLEQELAPEKPEQIKAFKAELDQLKEQTQNSEFSSLLDIQKNAAETMELLFEAGLELQRINTVNLDCRPEGPLGNAIALLEKAEGKSDLAKKRIITFKSSNPGLIEKLRQSGFEETRMLELNNSIKAELAAAKQLKFDGCR